MRVLQRAALGHAPSGGPKQRGRRQRLHAALRPDPSVLIIGERCPRAQRSRLRDRRALTEKADFRRCRRRFARRIRWYVHCSVRSQSPIHLSPMSSGNSLRRLGRVTIVDRTPMQFRALVVCCALCVLVPRQPCGGRALGREVAGRVRHQGGAERPLERGDVSLGEGGRARSRPTPPPGTTSAIGYEHEGKFDEARKAYEKAVDARSQEPR